MTTHAHLVAILVVQFLCYGLAYSPHTPFCTPPPASRRCRPCVGTFASTPHYGCCLFYFAFRLFGRCVQQHARTYPHATTHAPHTVCLGYTCCGTRLYFARTRLPPPHHTALSPHGLNCIYRLHTRTPVTVYTTPHVQHSWLLVLRCSSCMPDARAVALHSPH